MCFLDCIVINKSDILLLYYICISITFCCLCLINKALYNQLFQLFTKAKLGSVVQYVSVEDKRQKSRTLLKWF